MGLLSLREAKIVRRRSGLAAGLLQGVRFIFTDSL